MIQNLKDIEKFESTPLHTRGLPESTYEMLMQGRNKAPDAPALSFFLQTADHARPTVLSYHELFSRITQAANMFRRLGIGPRDVVAFVLPNLP